MPDTTARDQHDGELTERRRQRMARRCAVRFLAQELPESLAITGTPKRCCWIRFGPSWRRLSTPSMTCQNAMQLVSPELSAPVGAQLTGDVYGHTSDTAARTAVESLGERLGL